MTRIPIDLLRPLTAVALSLALSACSGGAGQASVPDAPAGAAVAAGPRAEVSFADLDAIHADLAARRGRAVFVNFWATWCVPCVEEMPELAALARECAGKGPDFVGVSVDAWVTGEGRETEDKVREALARAGVLYRNLIYRGDQDPLVSAFNLPGPIPYSVLYGPTGRVAATWVGPVPIEALRDAVAHLP
ncbi:MAG TPA: TlpA disulfide reductase family protein [Candidatus Polarisedimenticolia bacterium]|nr:TlpA disulfide reductase family protein [Candidatus Polarisedimenticolia bacterium]